jgi:NIMA (never in mitosis gene a)-related kinase
MSQHSSIEDFDLLGRLGSGSFGTVYKARRHADDMIYVIKVVRIVELSLKEQQDAINEVTILSQLESPYVVRYFDSFISGDSLHLVMEYCNKGDLQRLIKKMKDKELVGLEERVTWNISLQVILGLHYLHCKKVLHRDLKSANVFLTMEAGRGNERYTVKIGDLGVAKLLETSTAFAQTIVGTP